MSSRREFVHGALATGAFLLGPRTARAAEARIDVLADEIIGTISPNIYGHFVEHHRFPAASVTRLQLTLA